MDKTIYLINLYDYYEGLLTEKQKEYFKDYYFDNLSLSEMSLAKNTRGTPLPLRRLMRSQRASDTL